MAAALRRAHLPGARRTGLEHHHPDEVHNRRLRIQQLNTKLGSLGFLPENDRTELRMLQASEQRYIDLLETLVVPPPPPHLRLPIQAIPPPPPPSPR